MKTVTFSEAAKPFILEVFNKAVDKAGYIIERDTGERIVDMYGNEVQLSDFAGIRKGSEIIVTKDLPSLLDQAEFVDD